MQQEANVAVFLFTIFLPAICSADLKENVKYEIMKNEI